MPIRNFREDWVRDVADGIGSKRARANLPHELHAKAKIKIEIIALAGALQDLLVPPGNKFKRLQPPRSDEYSIRINDQWRIVFRYDDSGKTVYDVLIEDYH